MMNKMLYPPVTLPAAVNLSNMKPQKIGKIIPAVEPAALPNPIRDPTARFGNISEAVEYRFADHAWCADPAKPIKKTAAQSPTCVTNRIGTTQSAKMNIEVLRARVTLQPFLIRWPGN